MLLEGVIDGINPKMKNKRRKRYTSVIYYDFDDVTKAGQKIKILIRD